MKTLLCGYLSPYNNYESLTLIINKVTLIIDNSYFAKLWFIIIIIYCVISGAGGGQSISQQQRTNSSVHVCWHRSTTVPVAEYHRSLRNLLSGYLLRKFKSSNGWQKLWVIFTNSCLFFFKTFEDDCPLASLPLLGYSVRFDATFTVKMI